MKSWLGHTRKALNELFIEGVTYALSPIAIDLNACMQKIWDKTGNGRHLCNLLARLSGATVHGSGAQSMNTAAASADDGAVETPGGVSTGGKAKELLVSYRLLMESGSNSHEVMLKGICTKAESLVNDTSLIATSWNILVHPHILELLSNPMYHPHHRHTVQGTLGA